MNLKLVEEFFTNDVPALPFYLKAGLVVTVNLATLKQAKELALSLSKDPSPSLMKFLETVSENDYDNLDEQHKRIMDSDGYTRFVFYLTIYCNHFDSMLEAHAMRYLPMIGIDLDDIVNIEYYPCVYDEASILNPHNTFFDGDISMLFWFCKIMNQNFIRVNLSDDYVDISAIDVLGYVNVNTYQ